ncbi:hypothetical protein NW762_005419 [Fusarium torreyae]|uniref:Uncharacterized protein n=1 Tax=Fusarium torreyae TaxID=1237075 RepID=A0A9W8S4M7_9HYPO|nr:hypothetical protein NW762_005419 [Fusarium torreyae]
MIDEMSVKMFTPGLNTGVNHKHRQELESCNKSFKKVTKDAKSLLKSFKKIKSGLRKESGALKQAKRGLWRIWKRVAFVIEEDTIKAHVQTVEHLKSLLYLLFSIVGLASISLGQESIEKAILGVSKHISHQSQEIEGIRRNYMQKKRMVYAVHDGKQADSSSPSKRRPARPLPKRGRGGQEVQSSSQRSNIKTGSSLRSASTVLKEQSCYNNREQFDVETASEDNRTCSKEASGPPSGSCSDFSSYSRDPRGVGWKSSTSRPMRMKRTYPASCSSTSEEEDGRDTYGFESSDVPIIFNASIEYDEETIESYSDESCYDSDTSSSDMSDDECANSRPIQRPILAPVPIPSLLASEFLIRSRLRVNLDDWTGRKQQGISSVSSVFCVKSLSLNDCLHSFTLKAPCEEPCNHAKMIDMQEVIAYEQPLQTWIAHIPRLIADDDKSSPTQYAEQIASCSGACTHTQVEYMDVTSCMSAFYVIEFATESTLDFEAEFHTDMSKIDSSLRVARTPSVTCIYCPGMLAPAAFRHSRPNPFFTNSTALVYTCGRCHKDLWVWE